MSRPASKTQPTQPRTTRGFLLRTLLAVALTLVVAGGYFLWKNSSAMTADPVEQTEADEFALIDEALQSLDKPDGEPRLLKASFGDVVTAGHQSTSGEQSTVQTVGFGRSQRPESNPPAWLDGTIEIEPAAPQSSHAAIEEPLPFRRFTRK